MSKSFILFFCCSIFLFACKKDKEFPEINQFEILNNQSFQYGDTIKIAFKVRDCEKRSAGLDQILFQLSLDQKIIVQGLNASNCELKGVFNFVLKDKYFPTGSPSLSIRATDNAGNQSYLAKSVQYTTLAKKRTHTVYQNNLNQVLLQDTFNTSRLLWSATRPLQYLCAFNNGNVIAIPFVNESLRVIDTLGNVLVSIPFLDSTKAAQKIDAQRFYWCNDDFGLKFMNHSAAVTSPSIWEPFSLNHRIKDQALVGNYIGILESAGGQFQLRVHYQASALKNTYTLGLGAFSLGHFENRLVVFNNEGTNAQMVMIDPDQSNIPNATSLSFKVKDLVANGKDELLILTQNNELILMDVNGSTQNLGAFNVQHIMYDVNTDQFYFSADQLIYGIQGNSTFVYQNFNETVIVFDFIYNK